MWPGLPRSACIGSESTRIGIVLQIQSYQKSMPILSGVRTTAHLPRVRGPRIYWMATRQELATDATPGSAQTSPHPETLHDPLAGPLRRLIRTGDLAPGTRLRPTEMLGVSRNVVALAYDQLQLEGYRTARVGAGTWVPDEPVTVDSLVIGMGKRYDVVVEAARLSRRFHV